jgi:hypothetical protein
MLLLILMKRFLLLYEALELNLRELKEKLRKNGLKVNDVRLGHKYLELDIFSESIIDDIFKIKLITDLNLKEVVNLSEPRTGNPLDIYPKLFEEGRYWECHEVIEPVWREEKDVEKKEILRGLILLATAFVKWQKGQIDVSKSMIDMAFERLKKLRAQK